MLPTRHGRQGYAGSQQLPHMSCCAVSFADHGGVHGAGPLRCWRMAAAWLLPWQLAPHTSKQQLGRCNAAWQLLRRACCGAVLDRCCAGHSTARARPPLVTLQLPAASPGTAQQRFCSHASKQWCHGRPRRCQLHPCGVRLSMPLLCCCAGCSTTGSTECATWAAAMPAGGWRP